MNARSLGLALLTLCILGGLAAAFFSPALAATLTLPAASNVGQRATSVVAHPSATTSVGTQPSGVTVLAQDTFQRPDQQFWGRASDGRIWSSDANSNPAFSIVRDAGQITGVTGVVQGTLDASSPDAQILLSGTVSVFDANGNINLGGVLRWQNADNWYKVLIDGTNLQLLKDVNGDVTMLQTLPFQAQAGTSYSMRFQAVGSNFFAKAWPSAQAEPANWTIMVIDTSLTMGVSGLRVKLIPDAVIRVTSFIETSASTM